jgi:DNA repair ATPase RecN
VLTGLNGAGKTSLLQAILLAAHASSSNACTLSLNGPFNLELGTAEDVLNWMRQSPIEVHVTEIIDKAMWRFAVPNEEDLYLEVANRL